MNKFWQGRDVGIHLAALIAVLALAGTFGFMLLVPAPSVAGIATAQRREESELIGEADRLRKEVETRRQAVSKVVWSIPAQEVGPKAVALVTRLAATTGTKLNGIRPQRSTTEGRLEMMPYVVSAEGSFPNVVRFVKGLETPETRLTVTLIQMASADGATDRVTATVGLTAYRMAEGAKRG